MHGKLRDRVVDATGHSRGIVSAIAIAAPTTFGSFTDTSLKALKCLLFPGLRGQQMFPVTSLVPNLVQDDVSGGEGIPSSMLSATGLYLTALSPHVTKTDSLNCTGSHAFVVCWPSCALYGLVTNLREICAPSGAGQIKVPFGQGKPVFSVMDGRGAHGAQTDQGVYSVLREVRELSKYG